MCATRMSAKRVLRRCCAYGSFTIAGKWESVSPSREMHRLAPSPTGQLGVSAAKCLLVARFDGSLQRQIRSESGVKRKFTSPARNGTRDPEQTYRSAGKWSVRNHAFGYTNSDSITAARVAF